MVNLHNIFMLIREAVRAGRARGRVRGGRGRGRGGGVPTEAVDGEPDSPEREELSESESEDEEGQSSQENVPKGVTEDPGLLGSKIPAYESPKFSDSDQEKLDNANSAVDFFELLKPDDYIALIVEESYRYSVQRGFNKQYEFITPDNIR